MLKPVYSAIDAAGAVMQPGEHKAVRVEHPLLARPIIVTAARSPERMTHDQAVRWVESLDTYGCSWRLPTVEEALLICDRTRKDPVLPPEHFPDCQGEWIWSRTPVAWESGAAWGVLLNDGFTLWLNHNFNYHARAVRAGQF